MPQKNQEMNEDERGTSSSATVKELAYREEKRVAPPIAASVLAVLLMLALCFPARVSSAWSVLYKAVGLEDAFPKKAEGSLFALHVLNVGKADALLLESNGSFAMVDFGTPDRGPEVAAYLKARGVEKLEFAVATHPDNDHIGGMEYVLAQYPAPLYTADSAQLSPGERLMLGDAEILALGPISAPKSSEDTNNASVVLKISAGETSFLLTGDAGAEEEAAILQGGADLHADVLKVGHHGSATGTSPEFLDAVCPLFAAISVADDVSALPKDSVLLRLAESGAKILRTDVSGTLLFISNGENITVKKEG